MNEIMMIIGGIIALIISCFTGYWRRHTVPFLIAAGVSWFTGFYFGDIYSNNFGLSIGAAFILFGLFCFGEAMRYIFWREG